MKRTILIVTERRADYSKFRPILKEIEKSKKLDYFLIATGSHLLQNYGDSINEIYSDGFKISKKFHMYSKNKKDSEYEMSKAFGKCVLKLSDIVKELNPTIILSGFDIGSNLAVSIVGAHFNKIVAHVEGGEVTGTIDESIRHAITKFSHLHFTSNKEATKRLVKMGEKSRLIFTVGNPSLDNILNVPKISINKLENEFNIDMKKPFIIVIQHTVTTEIAKTEEYVLHTINAINELKIQSVIILGNVDSGSQKIVDAIKKSGLQYFTTISFDKYINLLKHSSALVGNSSSGIMEAPFLHIPTINIGSRQSGRLSAKSVLHVDYDKKSIMRSILKALNDKNFLKIIKQQKNYYGEGKTSKKIVNILENIDLDEISVQKQIEY
jgi:GDP/UDP-N,N'-diacetylbacillosamine 2-epimerase (hydrolysing)